MKESYKPLKDTPLSVACRAGDFLFISGLLGFDPQLGKIPAGIQEQTRNILEKIKAVLADYNATLDDVVKTTIYLTHIREDYAGMNEVYRTFFPANPPARAAVQIDMAADARIEIDAIAYLGQ